MIRVSLRIILIVLTFYFIPCLSHARDSVFESGEINSLEQAQEISNPLLAKMIYGRIDDEGEVDFYKFTFSQETTLPVEIFVPQKKEYQNFQPSLVVLGPNFIKDGTKLPFALPRGNGVVLLNSQGAYSQTFNDKATLTSYLRRAVTEADFKKDQLYYLAVFDNSGGRGVYVIKIGEEEVWGPREVLNAGRAIVRLKLGRWHLAKSIGIIMAMIVALITLIRLQRSQKTEEERLEQEI